MRKFRSSTPGSRGAVHIIQVGPSARYLTHCGRHPSRVRVSAGDSTDVQFLAEEFCLKCTRAEARAKERELV